MIRFTCPHCEKALRAPDARAGRLVRCPACGDKVTIPDAEAERPQPDDADDDHTTAAPNRHVGGERPSRRGPPEGDPDAVDPGPRRRKRRRARRDREGGAGFSVVDAIPLDYSLQITLGAGVGFSLWVLGGVLQRFAGVPLSAVGLLLIPLGTLFWLWGCAAYAKNKGYPELLGALGLFGCFGLIVLILLPDQSRG